MSDLISRQAAIDAVWDGTNYDIYTREVKERLEQLPSAEPQITYQYCEKVLMKLWGDGVIFFCEYDRIMDRLKKRIEVTDG